MMVHIVMTHSYGPYSYGTHTYGPQSDHSSLSPSFVGDSDVCACTCVRTWVHTRPLHLQVEPKRYIVVAYIVMAHIVMALASVAPAG